MAITVTNLQDKLLVNPHKIKKQVKIILQNERKSIDVISVVFVSKDKIKQLNKKFLGKNLLTDVLSFDNSLKLPEMISSWEIIICTDAAIKNAKIFKTSPNFELKLYLIHGILHLLGFDDKNAAMRNMMQKKENYILEFLEKNDSES